MTEQAVSFSLSAGELTVRDEAGGGEVVVTVDEEASITPATDAWFDVPVDDAVSLETSSLEIRGGVSAQFRGVDGEHYGSLGDGEFSVGGETYIDFTAAMKFIVYADAEMTGRLVGDEKSPESLFVAFDEPTRVVVGARSFHEAPIATMTVTDDPEALMTAASYLGSSIKEWSAERSWPTLRGHPPAIEVGDELHVPDELSRPDTEVTVAVPRDIGDVLRVTPLAHYFGADVVPADRAELRLDSHYVEPLGTGAELEQSVDELLAHAVVLDSLVRIGGYYSLPRFEYDELAPELPFYPPELYDEPVHRQLLEYLEVPFETVLPYAPDWNAVGTLRPRVEDAETVPYLLNIFSRVHVTDDGLPRESPNRRKPVELSTSTTVPRNTAAFPPAARARAVDHQKDLSGDSSVLFVGATRPTPDRFADTDWSRFHVEGEPTADYRPSVDREELASLLAEPYTHVHYGGAVTDRGFVCDDGVLPFEELPEGTVGSISFQWGRPSTTELVDLLDTATVACLTDERLSIGTAQELAVYLVLGRSVASSARLAGVGGVRYLGDSLLPVAKRPVGYGPTPFRVERAGPDEYRLSTRVDTNEHDLIGRVSQSRVERTSEQFRLSGNWIDIPGPFTAEELEEVLRTDGIFRFDWRPRSEQPLTTPELDDLFPE